MNEEINAYYEYLLNFDMVKKPQMPNFDVGAYTDNEYKTLIFDLLHDFDMCDDFNLTINHLKGDWWK